MHPFPNDFYITNIFLQIKKGPFHEHSPVLYDIAGVPNWQKVNTGLLKMYINEVLKKHPIVQHFLFGNLLPFRPAENVKTITAAVNNTTT